MVANELKIDELDTGKDKDKAERAVDLLATGLADTLFRNRFFVESTFK